MTFHLDVIQGNMVLGPLNGTLMNGATLISGMVGNAIYIDGNMAYVDFGIRTSGCFFDPSDCDSGMTVSFWLRIHSIRSSFDTFVDNGGCLFEAIGFCVWTERGRLGITSRNVLSWFYAGIPLPSLMKWNFITVSINNGAAKFFVNGCHTSINYGNGGDRYFPFTMQLPLTIGKRNVAVPEFAIDSIRIWYTELTPKEVWDLYSDADGNSAV